MLRRFLQEFCFCQFYELIAKLAWKCPRYHWELFNDDDAINSPFMQFFSRKSMQGEIHRHTLTLVQLVSFIELYPTHSFKNSSRAVIIAGNRHHHPSRVGRAASLCVNTQTHTRSSELHYRSHRARGRAASFGGRHGHLNIRTSAWPQHIKVATDIAEI